MSYPTKKLGDKDILFMSSGGTPSRGKLEYYKGDIVWLKSGELNDNQHINNSEERISEKALSNSSAKIFPKNTVLFAMYGATAGKLGILDVSATTNQAVAGMICNEKVLYYQYLFYFLLNTREKIIDKAWGGAQPNLSQTIIKNIPIPLPPLEIQKKIVERIERLMGKIDKAKKLRKEAMADTSSLIPSALNKIFSPHTSSLRGKEGKKKGWEEKTIGDLCIINPRADIKNLAKDMEVSFVPMKAVDEKDGIITIHETRKLSEVAKGYTYFANNDVLFAKITPCMENGKSVIARDLKNGIGFGSTEFHVLRTKGEVLPELIHYHLRQKSFRDEAKKKMTGSAGQKRVPKDFIEKTKIPLPPLPEQQKIVKYLDSLSEKTRKIKTLQSATDRELKLLEKSVLNRAFMV